jgi:hypothetical protein
MLMLETAFLCLSKTAFLRMLMLETGNRLSLSVENRLSSDVDVGNRLSLSVENRLSSDVVNRLSLFAGNLSFQKGKGTGFVSATIFSYFQDASSQYTFLLLVKALS